MSYPPRRFIPMTSPHTLRDLIREHIDRTGDSYQAIATKTGLSKALVGIMATSTEPRAYRADTVEKIANGLRLPVSIVTRAATASAGMSIDEPADRATRDDARIIADLLDDLTDEELAMLRVMVRAVVEARHGR